MFGGCRESELEFFLLFCQFQVAEKRHVLRVGDLQTVGAEQAGIEG